MEYLKRSFHISFFIIYLYSSTLFSFLSNRPPRGDGRGPPSFYSFLFPLLSISIFCSKADMGDAFFLWPNRREKKLPR